MRRFVEREDSALDRVLLIESAPRDLGEQALELIYQQGRPAQVDILTCFDAPPRGFDFDRGSVFSVHDQRAREDRMGFIRELCEGPYTAVAVMATGSRILNKWKWLIAARSSAKLILLDDRGQIFPADIWHLRQTEKLIARRLNPFRDTNWGLLEASLAAFALGLLVPFKLLYLSGYTARVHIARWLRMRRKRASFAR